MGHKTLSVLIANYNHAHFIGEALDSVLSQSRQPDEILVLDDGSTDDSVAVISELARRNKHLRLLRNERNMGVLFCVNRLLRLAQGDIIHCLGADDKNLPGIYEKSLSILERNPQAALCVGLVMIMDEDGGRLRRYRTPVVSERECYLAPRAACESFRKWGNWLAIHSVLFDRRIALDLGMYDPDLILAWEGVWFMAMAARHGICFIPEPLSIWRQCRHSEAFRAIQNFDRTMEVQDRHERWLLAKFGDVFSRDYVELWRRRSLSGMIYGMLQDQPQRHDLMIRIIELMPPNHRTVSDRALLAALRAFPGHNRLSAKLYVWLQLPLADRFRSLGRKLRRLLPN
jgi:glycosyltransferase involved in cell wall biosynthesis